MSEEKEEQKELQIARTLMKRYPLIYVPQTDKFYKFKRTYYESWEEEKIKNMVTNYYIETRENFSLRKRSRVIEFLKSLNEVDVKELNANPNRIPLLNGHYIFGDKHKSKDGKYPEDKFIHAADVLEMKENPYTYCINAEYDPKAINKEMDWAFKEIFNEDKDGKEEIYEPEESKVRLIYEIFAYCIMPSVKYQKAFMFLGEGGNGKGIISEVLRAFLGRYNVSGVPLQKFEKDFKLEFLRGKLANIFTDLPYNKLKHSSAFKRVVADPWLDSEIKHKQERVEFKNITKLLFSTNKTAEVYDDTKAFWRRWVLLRFNVNFEEDPDPDDPLQKKKDPNLLEKLITKNEMTGLFNRCIHGYHRLEKRGMFPKKFNDVEWIKGWWTLESNPLDLFLKECCKIDPTARVNKDKFHKAFCEFREKHGVDALDKGWFTRKLKKVNGIDDDRNRNLYTGIKLKEKIEGDLPISELGITEKDLNSFGN